MSNNGIDISPIISLVQYLNGDDMQRIIRFNQGGALNNELLVSKAKAIGI